MMKVKAPMSTVTKQGRITWPVVCLGQSGKPFTIPVGPCLVERDALGTAQIIWGDQAENHAWLSTPVLTDAQHRGAIVMLE